MWFQPLFRIFNICECPKCIWRGNYFWWNFTFTFYKCKNLLQQWVRLTRHQLRGLHTNFKWTVLFGWSLLNIINYTTCRVQGWWKNHLWNSKSTYESFHLWHYFKVWAILFHRSLLKAFIHVNSTDLLKPNTKPLCFISKISQRSGAGWCLTWHRLVVCRDQQDTWGGWMSCCDGALLK